MCAKPTDLSNLIVFDLAGIFHLVVCYCRCHKLNLCSPRYVHSVLRFVP
jgi:hypothetical protein